jgi:hypothetical protein
MSKLVAVPKTQEALRQLALDQAASSSLIEWVLTDLEFAELWQSGVFTKINGACGTMIDDFEAEHIVNIEELRHCAAVVSALKSLSPALGQLDVLVQEALQRKTGIFFYF